MLSMRKLAEMAGVSHVTVYRALRNAPGVSDTVRARILHLAQEYTLLPPREQAGMSPRAQVVGCLVADLDSDYQARFLRGLLREMRVLGYQVMILEHHADATHLRLALQSLLAYRVEGIFIMNTQAQFISMESVLAMWSHGCIPICVGHPSLPLDRVAGDEEELGEIAVDSLLRLGHTRIAFVGDLADQRTVGVRHALQRRKLTDRYLREEAAADGEVPCDTARRIFTRLRAMTPPPTALIAAQDYSATLFLQTAVHLGVRVPQELSVMGFGNLNVSLYTIPALTTIDHRMEEVAVQACRLFTRRRADATPPSARTAEEILIPARLIKRDSTAPCTS